MCKALLSYLIVALAAGPALCCCVTKQQSEQPSRPSSTAVGGCPHCQQTRTESRRELPRRQECPCRQLGQCGLMPPATKPAAKVLDLPRASMDMLVVGTAAIVPQL